MPGRQQVPSFQLASGTTDERDGSYNLTTLGSIFYNTDTSNVEVYHEDPSNNLGWRDLVMNNKEQIDISGNVDISGTITCATAPTTGSELCNKSYVDRKTFSFKQYDADDKEYYVSVGNPTDTNPDGNDGVIDDDILTCFVTTVGGNYSGVSLDFSVAGEWQSQTRNKGVAIAKAKHDGSSYVYDKILRAAVSDGNARVISQFNISYNNNHTYTLDGCNGKYIDTDIDPDTLYSYTVLLVNTGGNTAKFKLNRVIDTGTGSTYERGVSSITAQLFT